MLNRWLMSALIVVSVALSSGAFAATDRPSRSHEGGSAAHSQRLSGAVVSVDPAAKTLVIKHRRADTTVGVSDATKIRMGEEAKTLADIKPGSHVKVVYGADKSVKTAAEIVIKP